MKVLVAYDRSESADTAIDGLRRAGLPIEAEALVVSGVFWWEVCRQAWLHAPHAQLKLFACEMEVFEYVRGRNKTTSRC